MLGIRLLVLKFVGRNIAGIFALGKGQPENRLKPLHNIEHKKKQ